MDGKAGLLCMYAPSMLYLLVQDSDYQDLCSLLLIFYPKLNTTMFINKTTIWSLILAVTLSATACQDHLDPSTPGADFTRYVAVGNSLTAGYANNGLYRSGQLNAYPVILAGQLKMAGGGDFTIPLFSTEQADGTGYLKLVKMPQSLADLATAIVSVAPPAVRGLTPAGSPLFTKYVGTGNQNLGVPGIRMGEILLPGYGSTQGNPFFERLLPDAAPLTTTYLDYVSSSLTNATFFSCWMGNNDVLNYATSGGIMPLTETGLFTNNYTALITKLTENNRKGVVIGIPAITTIPYFTTISVPLLLAQINDAVKPPSPITALVIQSPAAPGGIRATKPGDLLLLESLAEYAKIGRPDVGTGQGPYGLSPANPLLNQYVLDADEVAALTARADEFNTLMRTAAESRGLAYVDPNVILAKVMQGFTENGVTYTSAFISGGVFSLDGVHQTPAGYALITNEIIRAINAKYHTAIPTVDASQYDRIVL